MKFTLRNVCFKHHVFLLLFLSFLSAASASFHERTFIDKSVRGSFNGLQTDDGFQLITHGRPGQLFIDGHWKDATAIAAFLKPRTAGFQHVNIYGCEFARGEKGRSAVAYLQRALNVSVAASDDITGRDGDWNLEVGTYVSIKGMENYNGNLQCADSLSDVIAPGTMNFPTNTYLHTVDTPITTPIEDFTFMVDRLGTSGGILWQTNPALRVTSEGPTYRGGTLVFNKPLDDFNLLLWNLTSWSAGRGERARFTAYDIDGNPIRWESYAALSGYEAGTVVSTSGTNNATTTIQGKVDRNDGVARARFYYDAPISKITIEAEYFGSTDDREAFVEFQVEGGCAVEPQRETGPMPVKFGQMRAWIQSDQLHVNWQTLSESNISHFELEVSQDGKVWRKAGDNIASKAIDGSSSTPYSYHASIPLGAAVMGISMLLLSLSTLFGRRKWLGVIIFISGAVLLMYGCSKGDRPSLDGDEKIHVRIKQVDKDSTASYSKAITAIRK